MFLVLLETSAIKLTQNVYFSDAHDIEQCPHANAIRTVTREPQSSKGCHACLEEIKLVEVSSSVFRRVSFFLGGAPRLHALGSAPYFTSRKGCDRTLA